MSCGPDLAALHDALGCATAAVVHAWRDERDAASLSLIEAQAAGEEAFGCGSPEVDAFSVVLTAIAQAIHPKTKRPALVGEHHGRPDPELALPRGNQ